MNDSPAISVWQCNKQHWMWEFPELCQVRVNDYPARQCRTQGGGGRLNKTRTDFLSILPSSKAAKQGQKKGKSQGKKETSKERINYVNSFYISISFSPHC